MPGWSLSRVTPFTHPQSEHHPSPTRGPGLHHPLTLHPSRAAWPGTESHWEAHLSKGSVVQAVTAPPEQYHTNCLFHHVRPSQNPGKFLPGWDQVVETKRD